MKQFVQKLPAEISFIKVGIVGRKFPQISPEPKAGFTIIETDCGHETKIRQRVCDFHYYILQGTGYFEIDGNKENCEAGDLVVIPAGRAFQYFGKLKMLLVTTPPFLSPAGRVSELKAKKERRKAKD
jgi:mannose-6-phosphate isomerase-like protein (cupin superfamily)